MAHALPRVVVVAPLVLRFVSGQATVKQGGPASGLLADSHDPVSPDRRETYADGAATLRRAHPLVAVALAPAACHCDLGEGAGGRLRPAVPRFGFIALYSCCCSSYYSYCTIVVKVEVQFWLVRLHPGKLSFLKYLSPS